MDLNNFKLLKEHDDKYEIQHPQGKVIHIQKDKLSEQAHNMIKKMACGGEVKGYAKGGQAEDPYIGKAMDLTPADQSNEWLPHSLQIDKPAPESISNPGSQDLQKPNFQQLPPNVDRNTGLAVDLTNPNLMVLGQNNKLSPLADQMPQAEQASQSQMPQGPQMPDMSKGFEAQKQANINLAKAQSGQAAAESKRLDDFMAQQQAMKTQQDIVNSYKAKDQELQKAFMDQKIDPNRLWHNASTGSKIMASIGMMLSGAGAGAARQSNMAAQVIENAIDRDVQAQKNDQEKAHSLWQMNRQALHTDLEADLATKNQMYNALKYQLAATAAKFQGPQAMARAQAANALIDQQIGQIQFQRSMMDPSMNADPAVRARFLIQDPGDRRKAFAEIDAAKNTKKMGKEIMDAFELAVKENTIMRTGAGQLRVPGSVKALHQAMQPTFADLEGTVRQAAMDNTFSNITPAPGDIEHTIQQKRRSLQEYLRSKEAASTALGYGIDLSKDPRTHISLDWDSIERFDPQSGKTALFDPSTKQFIRYK
jgi:hypothetical protein